MFQTIPRAREVGQGWVSSAWTTLVAFGHAVKMVAEAKPDVLLLNGPGCVPRPGCEPAAPPHRQARWRGGAGRDGLCAGR